MKKIVILASVLYFLLAPFSFHPDTKLTLRYPGLDNGKVWDVYKYVAIHSLDIPDFHYPPVHFWWLKLHYPISKFIGGDGFDQWLGSSGFEANFNELSLRYNLATKFPLLLLGLLSGYLIFLIVKRETGNESKGMLAALFWYFNPITLYSLVMMGQNDVVAITLFLSGIWFINRWYLVILLWGMAAGVKSYPLIWGSLFFMAVEKNVFRLFFKILSLFLVYGLILLPWIGKDYFVESVLNSGLSTRMFVANIPIGFDKQILIVPFLMILIGLKSWGNKNNNIILASLAIIQSCMVIYGFSHFNPQWMLWMIPFLAIWIFSGNINSRVWIYLVIIFGCWVGLTLGFDDKYLTWGLLTPINPNLINFPSLIEFARNKSIDLSGLINLAQTIMAGISVWFIFGTKSWPSVKNFFNIKPKLYWIIWPWVCLILLMFLSNLIKVDYRIDAIRSESKLNIEEMSKNRYSFLTNKNLKYLELYLNNPGAVSQDEATLVIDSDDGLKSEKVFSGFNSGENNVLRFDIPDNMKNSEKIYMSFNNLNIKDGKLNVYLDKHDQMAVNFVYHDWPSLNLLFDKILNFWWWWILVIGFSIFYIV